VSDRSGTSYEPHLLSIRETAEALGVSRQTIYRLAAAGDLPVVKIGDRSLFPPRDVEALIDRSTRQGRV
jgi:excisionase family DNA binding protein